MTRTISCVPRKARKVYRCIWCGQDIQIGDLYTRCWVKHEGDLFDQHWHNECIEYSVLIADAAEYEFEPHSHNRPSADVLTWIYPQQQ